MSSPEMRAKSSEWNLACDVQLRKRLEKTAQKFQEKAKSLTDSIDELDQKTTVTSAKLGKSKIFEILY